MPRRLHRRRRPERLVQSPGSGDEQSAAGVAVRHQARFVATLGPSPGMMRRSRQRLGLRGVSRSVAARRDGAG
jgi:hypothetical protein